MFDYSYSSITLRDAIVQEPTLLDEFVLETTEQTNMFKEIFRAKWDLYDIGGETIEIFKAFIDNRFALKKEYYQQLLNEYYDDFNYLDGRKTITSYSETVNTDNTNYDLPRKTGATGTATTKENVNGTHTYTRTLTGDVDMLDLKARYLKYIRNVYEDFANEFKDCFSLIYG